MARHTLQSFLLAAGAAATLVLAPAAQAAAPVGDAPVQIGQTAPLRAIAIPAIVASPAATFTIDTASIDAKPAPVIAPAAPASARTTASAGGSSAPSSGGYSFGVYQAGHQAALDRCDGWVWEDFGGYGRVVSAHNHCGGAVVLGLQVGDRVHLSGYGEGDYVITRLKTVPKLSPATVLEGRLWMQTCTWDGVTMRIAELTRV